MHAYIHSYIHSCMHTYIHRYIYTYMHTYIQTYIHTYNETDVILAPGASEVGLGAASLVPLCVDIPLPGLPGLSSARLLFVRRLRT